ncbi:RNA polymerase II core subunit [Heterostelium album PN500]|uniref:DNA-directed RNA polymerases I, II, and III subunit RPABC3 n=1 Tax=Heterostelium pallidum (strain ATCC 26659 / Pp 5 / PN500) TaxID=670386 RepID=D3BTL0_HETP5|nr:RNA polymerase II core subunit [Heterostelium album PN500]EFA75427.1 RNA polymerase II core subunit [Heterostelium album PN500]|eukprot:XP_020427561.1 RNA polymerase II core subunit [Heterostelium album PN500]
MSAILFEDTFEVKEIDPDGKKFDRVSRFICYGESYEMDLHIDIATHIYPMEHEKFKLVLASSLSLDGTMDISFDSNKPSLADKFDYVMFGKIFKYQKDNSSSKVSIFASFGGLLMLLQGDPRYLPGLELDARIYLLIKKI